MPDVRGYTAGFFAIELEGQVVGYATAVDGGAVVGQVIGADAGNPPVRRKDIGGIDYEPIVVEIGANVESEVFDWIRETLDNTQPRRDGAIRFLDYTYRDRGGLAWTDGLLTEIRFPELDAASKLSATIRLTVTAETITRSAAGGAVNAPAIASKSKKGMNASNFSLSIPGLDTGHVSWIGPITVRQPYVPPPSPGGGGGSGAPPPASLDVSDVSISIAEQRAEDFYDWHEDFVIAGNNGPGDERTGRLEFLDPTMKQPMLTLEMRGLGIYRIVPERQVAGASTIAKARADLYCEELELKVPAVAAPAAAPAPAPAPAGAPAPAVTAEPVQPVEAASADAVIGALRDLLLDSHATRLPAQPLDAERVAERLLRSTEELPPVEVVGDGRAAEGRKVGSDWARREASLDELEEIGAVAGTEWNALTLRAEHSLVARLRKHGAVAEDQVGDVVLSRDPFVEGVVDGAADVVVEVRPHLRERGRPRQ